MVMHAPASVTERGTTGPWLYDAVISHTRLAPVRHVFANSLRPWLVDLDTLDDQGHPRQLPGWTGRMSAFRGADHFDGVASTLRGAVDRWCAAHDRPRPHRVLTLAQPRCFGYVFNPLSVHWLYNADGSVDVVLAEVHNTYAGRHVYEVHRDTDGRAQVDKAFPVSPFFTTAGHYQMRITDPGEQLEVSITLVLPAAATDPTTGAAEPAADAERETTPFVATLRGTRIAANPRTLLTTIARHIWPSLRVSVLIRRHGIQLYLQGRKDKRLPVQPHPRRSSWEGSR
jgi:DUF1365 family protein